MVRPPVPSCTTFQRQLLARRQIAGHLVDRDGRGQGPIGTMLPRAMVGVKDAAKVWVVRCRHR